MKKVISVFMIMILLVCCTACTSEEKNDSSGQAVDGNKTEDIVNGLDFLPLEFYFSSGAGGWGTELTLNPDGAFTGKYHDSEMGSTGEDYPYGTYYICEFTGSFENITKVNDYTYTMTIGEVGVKNEIDSEWIEDGVKYIASYPYGLEGSEKFKLLTPDAPIAEFSEDFLIWWPGRYEEVKSDTLGYYCIMNIEQEYGFFTFE